MKKKIGVRIKAVLIFMVVLFVIIASSVAYHRSVMNNWNPEESLAGEWKGRCVISSSLRQGESSGGDAEERVDIKITIEADGNVSGKVGEAELVNCTVQLNRTWFERLIRVKTDYMITGVLQNGITLQDVSASRDIRIPFNLSEGTLSGSLFEVKGWEYPDPLIPRLALQK